MKACTRGSHLQVAVRESADRVRSLGELLDAAGSHDVSRPARAVGEWRLRQRRAVVQRGGEGGERVGVVQPLEESRELTDEAVEERLPLLYCEHLGVEVWHHLCELRHLQSARASPALP